MKKKIIIIFYFFNLIGYTQTFVDISDSVNLPNLRGLGYQGTWIDYNNDGHLDILGEDMQGAFLFKNNQGTSFSDVTSSSGLSGIFFSSVSIGDIDNDGWIDLLLNRKVFKNQNGGGFQEVFTTYEYTERTILLDYDCDGLLDIVGVTGDSLIIYKNIGNSNFVSITPNLNLPQFPDSQTLTAADFDNNGFSEFYIGRYGKPNQLLQNIAGEDFYNLPIFNGFGDPGGSVSVSTGDFNNDGLLDIYVGNIASSRNTLYKNIGDLKFSDITITAGVRDDGDARTASFIDYNNDGLLDIFSTNHVHSNKLFKNNGNETFTNVAVASNINEPQDGFGVSWADFDNDGDLDVLYVGHNGRLINIFRNDGGNNKNYLQIKLNGSFDNKIGIGSVVEIYFSGKYQKRQLNAGEGNTGHNYPILHFGLGNATVIDSALITWPSGAIQKFVNISANQRITVIQSGNIPPKIFRLKSPANNFTTADSIVNFSWSKSIDPDSNNTIFYFLRLTGSAIDTLIGPIQDTTMNINFNLLNFPSGELNWSVLASDGIDQRKSWETWKINRLLTGVELNQEISNNKELLNIFPNPTNANVILRLNIPERGKLTISIYDLLGNLVKDITNDKSVNPGINDFHWNFSNQPNLQISSGVYLIKVLFYPAENDNLNLIGTKKLLLIK